MPTDHARLQTMISILRHRWCMPLLLSLTVALVYVNSFPSAFIQDDIHIVQNNPLVNSFDLWQIFSSDYWHGLENSGLYRPLTILSLALNRLVTGTQPWGFHLVNLLLHLAVTLLLWLTLPRWGATTLTAALAALWFAVHPIHAEVINVVVGRSELLVACFALLALYFACGHSRRSHGLVWGCYALALLAKEHAIVLLALIPLFDFYQARAGEVWRRRWPLYAGLLTLSVLWLLLRHYGVMQASPRALYSTTSVPMAYLPWDERVLTALQYQWVYLAKLLVPFKLQSVYSLPDLPPVISSLWSLRALVVVGATAAAFGLLLYGWRQRQWWALLAVAYVVSFAPTANIVMPIGVTMAERLAYLPSCWLGALVGWAVAGIWMSGGDRQGLRLLIRGTLVGYVLFLALTAVAHNRHFASEIRLWHREVVQNPADYLGWYSYAEVLNANSRYDESEQTYLRLLKMQPEFQGAMRSYNSFLHGRGRHRESIAPVAKALQLARQQGDVVGSSYDLINLAAAYVELNDFPRALAYLQEPEAKLFVQQHVYLGLLGRALQGVGDHAAAVAAFEQVHDYTMDLKIPLYHGLSLFQLGRLAEAQRLLLESIRLNEMPEAWNLLGVILSKEGEFSQAIEAFGKAVRLAPENRRYQENLEHARSLNPPASSLHLRKHFRDTTGYVPGFEDALRG